MTKFAVTIGKDFLVDGIEIDDVDAVERIASIDERRRLVKQQTRLTYGVLGAFSFAMVVSTCLGWFDSSFDEVAVVWSMGSPWAAWIMGRYFKKD